MDSGGRKREKVRMRKKSSPFIIRWLGTGLSISISRISIMLSKISVILCIFVCFGDSVKSGRKLPAFPRPSFDMSIFQGFYL